MENQCVWKNSSCLHLAERGPPLLKQSKVVKSGIQYQEHSELCARLVEGLSRVLSMGVHTILCSFFTF